MSLLLQLVVTYILASLATADVIEIVNVSSTFTSNQLAVAFMPAFEAPTNSANMINTIVDIEVQASALDSGCNLPPAVLPSAPPSASPIARALLLDVDQMSCDFLFTFAPQLAALGYSYIMVWSSAAPHNYEPGSNFVRKLISPPDTPVEANITGYIDIGYALGSYLTSVTYDQLSLTQSGDITTDNVILKPVTLVINLTSGDYYQRLTNNVLVGDAPIVARVSVIAIAAATIVLIIVEAGIQRYNYYQNDDTLNKTPSRVYAIYALSLLVTFIIILDSIFDPFGLDLNISGFVNPFYCGSIVLQGCCYLMSYYLLLSAVQDDKDRFTRLIKSKNWLYVLTAILALLTELSKLVYFYLGTIVVTYVLFMLSLTVIASVTVAFFIEVRSVMIHTVHRGNKQHYRKMLLLLTVAASMVILYGVVALYVIVGNPTSSVAGQVALFLCSHLLTLTYVLLMVLFLSFCHWTNWLPLEFNKPEMRSLIKLKTVNSHNHLVGHSPPSTPSTPTVATASSSSNAATATTTATGNFNRDSQHAPVVRFDHQLDLGDEAHTDQYRSSIIMSI